jgi:hypothetical protein
MSSFLRCFKAERIKWRRGWTLLTMLLAPATQVGFLFLIVWFSESRVTQFGAGFRAWYMINAIAWNLFFMPITVALVTLLSWDLEAQSRAWNLLLIQPTPRETHYLVKLASHFSLLLLSQVLLGLLLLLGGLILRTYVPTLSMGPIAPEMMFRFAGFSLLASLPVIGLHTWVASRVPGFGLGLALALGGTWLTFQLVGKGALISLVPWGTAAQIVDIALRAKPVPVLTYCGSVACAALLAILGMIDFKRRNASGA